MTVTVATIEHFLDSLNLPYSVEEHTPLTSIKNIMHPEVLKDMHFNVKNTVKHLVLTDMSGNAYLLMTSGMSNVNLCALAQQVGAQQLNIATSAAQHDIFGHCTQQITVFDLLDHNESTQHLRLVLDSRISMIETRVAFHLSSDALSILVKACDVPAIAKAIQASYLTYDQPA